jgi:hypothetical protein
MAISAAIKTCLGCRPVLRNAAAAMEEETPISAWQPPIAADMVDPFLKILPISPATKRNCLISFRPHCFQSPDNTSIQMELLRRYH